MKVLAAFLVNTLINFIIGLLVAKFLGPDQFGRFALAMAVSMAVQVLAFEWIRQAAIRFYSARAAEDQPQFRATLDVSFAALSLVISAASVLFILSGLNFSLSNGLVALAFAAAIANGLFDYHTALVRARFQDSLYGKIVITKNILAFFLTVGGAYFFHSAAMTVAGVCVSMASSVIFARSAISDQQARPSMAQRALAIEHARYAMPIIAANFLYLAIPLANRAMISAHYGFAENGQFSLAFDIGMRLIAAVGSALDVLLFQIAVRADEVHGRDKAREQVAANMATIFAILTPAAAGLWLIMPSLEYLIVPSEFRGPFGYYLSLLLPGLFAFGLMNYAINAVFQISKATLALIGGAIAACIANAVLLLTIPSTQDAARFAIAQSGAFLGAFVTLTAFAIAYGAKWPRLRDVLLTLGATALMFATLYPMRAWTPGIGVLLVQIVVGGAIFAGIVAVFDIAQLRSHIVNAMRSLRRKQAPLTAGDAIADTAADAQRKNAETPR